MVPPTVKPKTIVLLVVLAIIVIVGLIVVLDSFYTITAGSRGLVLRFGQMQTGAIADGLHFKYPIVDQVYIMDIKTQIYEAEASAASKDLQIVTSKVAINYHLLAESVPTIFTEIGTDYQLRVIAPAVQEAVKSVTAQFTAEEAITRRSEVKEEIKASLRERLAPRGIIIEEVNLVNFDFSESFNAAIEMKATAVQNALTEKNKLAQIEYQAQQKVAEARGIAEATLLQANAEAEAIKIKTAAINSQGGANYVQLQAVNKWSGVLPQYMLGSSPMPFIDINTLGTK